MKAMTECSKRYKGVLSPSQPRLKNETENDRDVGSSGGRQIASQKRMREACQRALAGERLR